VAPNAGITNSLREQLLGVMHPLCGESYAAIAMNETKHIVDIPNGGQIALHRLCPDQPTGLPLIVAHGTISNAKTVRTMATFLAEHGFDCWMLEWGGHGDSQAGSPRQNNEYPAFNDVPTAVSHVLAATKHEKLFWVSHSGGGHLPMMFLSRDPNRQSEFAGLVTLGTQSTQAALSLKGKFGCAVLIGITTLLNRTPKRILPLGNEHEPTRLLAQWAVWNIRQRWLGKDGFDYMEALSGMSIPTMIIAGGKDRAAPVNGCREIYEAFGSGDNTWCLCDTESGFSKDFGHGELIRGLAARDELFPKIVDWLRERV